MPPKGSKGKYYGKGPRGGALKEVTGTFAKHNREFQFVRSDLANAFIHGVELVNDSSIRVIGVTRTGTRNTQLYTVLIQDDDYHPEDYQEA